MTSVAVDGAGVCAECEREVELCSFCDRPECSEPVCYPCVAEALTEYRPQPHEHGG